MFKADNGAVIYFNKILDLTFGSGLYLSLGVDCARSMSITTYNLSTPTAALTDTTKGMSVEQHRDTGFNRKSRRGFRMHRCVGTPARQGHALPLCRGEINLEVVKAHSDDRTTSDSKVFSRVMQCKRAKSSKETQTSSCCGWVCLQAWPAWPGCTGSGR